MKDVMDKLLDSWFELLNGQITIDGQEVKVSINSAANSDKFHHIELKPESETQDSNKRSFVTNAVVVLDIITVHPISINKSIVNSIYNQVMELLFPTRQCALPALDGLQISTVSSEGGTYLEEDDGTKKVHRKITRFIHRINQTS